MLKLKKYTPSNSSDCPCFHCDLSMLCIKSIDNNGVVRQEVLAQIKHPAMMLTEKRQLEEALSYAVRCKKQYPNNYVVNERVNQHVLVDKCGNEILRANSFWGLIGGVFGTTILTIIALSIFALVFCGIASIF